MKKLFPVICLLLAIISCGVKPKEKPVPDSVPKEYAISFEQIENMFNEMNASGVNTDTTMLYGYFFTDISKEKLDQAATELAKRNFEFVEIYPTDDKVFVLHVERKEIHNARSLFELDKELYAIAEKYKLASYDGFDVGNVDNTKPIGTKPVSQ
jgi:hypothetical protein